MIMTKEHPNLIYDVGLFDGGDTAYYLFRGYNVVAVDANPLMVEKAKIRFVKEMQAGRLTLLNIGISETPGTATFWVSDVPEWSSFDKTIASRDGTGHRPVCIATLPFPQLLAENGVPHYLKIDIEGNDRVCVDALRGVSKLPKYISVETECVGDSVVLSHEQSLTMLQSLHNVGYKRFKLVNQANGWSSVRSNFVAQSCLRLVNSAARGRLRVRGLSDIADKFTDSPRIGALGFGFTPGSSGPWGDDVPGSWMTFERARSIYLRERRYFFSRQRALYSFWYDWHATY
jgi:FkbM family methyltransferase